MKNLTILALFFVIFGCSKPEKPKLTVEQYVRQVNTIRGVVVKILDEPDFQKMHKIALAVESARAVSCISVAEECNLLGKILNRIVYATQTEPLTIEERINLFKMVAELDGESKKGQALLSKQWSEYNSALAESKN